MNCRFEKSGMTVQLCSQDATAVGFLLINIVQSERETAEEVNDAVIKESGKSDFAFAQIYVPDSGNALSPWNGPAVFGNEDFGSGAADTLIILEKVIIPEIKSRLHLAVNAVTILGGYSFSGLFALWAGYTSTLYDAVCGVSPSVWFPGWLEFAERESIKTKFMYLSVGRTEKKTRNRLMKCVEDNLKLQADMARKKLGVEKCLMELNDGNHFTDTVGRVARAFAKAMDNFL